MNEPEIQQIKAREKRNNIIVIVLAVILVALAIMYFLKDRDHRSIVRELNMEKDSIQMELSSLVTRYDSLAVETDTISDQLFFAQAKVKDLLLEIEQTKKLSLEQINSYQKQVTTLR
ncbi:MAG TPA: hypothetical protein VFD91_08305, partial [Mariniphaga sp.]|nr:hypothetical protein [Mariniphaga sp.]